MPFVRYDATSAYCGVMNRNGSKTVNRKNKRRLTLAARGLLVGLDEIACAHNRRKRETSETELRYFIFLRRNWNRFGELRETLRRWVDKCEWALIVHSYVKLLYVCGMLVVLAGIGWVKFTFHWRLFSRPHAVFRAYILCFSAFRFLVVFFWKLSTGLPEWSEFSAF